MSKSMAIKELLTMYGPIEILKEINKNFGALPFEDTCAIFDTYDELLNEDNEPIHRDRANKYHLELSIVMTPESAKTLAELSTNSKYFNSRTIRYFYYALINNGKRYEISQKYVKRVSDFSLCEISIPDRLTKLDCACLLILSFAVLNEKLIKCHGELRPSDYILNLKKQEANE